MMSLHTAIQRNQIMKQPKIMYAYGKQIAPWVSWMYILTVTQNLQETQLLKIPKSLPLLLLGNTIAPSQLTQL
jgi:hypothetical protein